MKQEEGKTPLEFLDEKIEEYERESWKRSKWGDDDGHVLMERFILDLKEIKDHIRK